MTDLTDHQYRPPLGDQRLRTEVPRHTPAPGDVLEVDTFVGTVTAVDGRTVTLADRRGRRRHFELDGQLAWLDERAVSIVAGQAPPERAAAPRTTASGSIAVPGAPARTARASRIWVEGTHDAELLELVWGDDLRHEGVVVEPLGGIDDLGTAVRAFGPGPRRRLGVLVDHLVSGSKEARISARVRHPHVLVTGHPYVDVWAAIRPSVLGIDAWPDVPMDEEWKRGICDRLGYSDPPTLWRELRGRVTDWHDLEQPLVRAVEQLLDHVTG
jgi:hypothetical protein